MINNLIKVVLGLALCNSALAEELPKLFLIGDSISIYYTPYLQAYLAPTYSFSRKASARSGSVEDQLKDPATQGGDSRMVLNYLRKRFGDGGFRPDVVLLNCGLHDIKRDPKTHAIAIDPQEYESNLNAIVDLLRSNRVDIVWINTTPVDDARHNSLSKQFHRYNADVKRYNEIADKVFTRDRISIIDLYTFTSQLGNNHYIDHVHFDETTRALQAAFISGFLDDWSPRRNARARQFN